MRVAVAEIAQHRFARALAGKFSRQPDLTGATLHLVGGGVLGLRHRIQRAAEFDDIPVAVVPVVEQREIIPDFVYCRHLGGMSPCETYIGPRRCESEFGGTEYQ